MGKIRMFLILIGMVLIVSSPCYAQWAMTYGGNEMDRAQSVRQTMDGGYIVLGYTSSFGAGGAWILKLNPDGTAAWQKTYSGGQGQAIEQTTDSGYILAGGTSSYTGSGDIWVVKLNSDGSVAWQKAYGTYWGSSHWTEGATSIQQTADGGYIVSSFVAITIFNEDILVLKLSSDGTVEWQKTYSAGGREFATSIRQTSDGGYIVAGGTFPYNFPYSGSTDYLVLKLNSDGSVAWQKIYGGSKNDSAHTVRQTSDGGYIVVGEGTSFRTQGSDLWVLKLNSDGTIVWQKTFRVNGTEGVSSYSIQQTADGKYVLAGQSGYDLWVFKLNSDGTVAWQKIYVGSYYDSWSDPRSVQQTTDGGYILAASAYSSPASSKDFLVVKLNENGEIPSCRAMGTSQLVASDTFVSDINVTATIGSASGFFTLNTSISPQDTSAITTEVCRVANHPPIANAGPDQTINCSGSGGTTVTLDGSQSSDSDGDSLTYTWTGPFGTASGVNPSVTIPLGAHTITLTVDDGKGGTAQDTVSITVEDNVPPSTTVTITGTSGDNGWYRSDVNVNLISTDNCAGCKELHTILGGVETTVSGSTANIPISGDGMHNLSYWAIDNGGNVEQTKTAEIKIDKTPSEIIITGVTEGGKYPVCNPPTPNYQVTDSMSGVNTSNATLTGGNANGVGTFTYSVTATDIAGNPATKTVTYKVTYSFSSGFQPPVTLDKPFKHGSTIPIKFELTNGCGNIVPTATATLTLQLYIAEEPAGEPIDATSNVPDSGNLFRFTEGHYIYNLSTDNLQVGKWLVTVTLDDGEKYTISIGIK